MGQNSVTWYDSFFTPFYRPNHRYLVETIALLMAAVIIHLVYGVLAQRQEEFLRPRLADPMPAVSPSVSIGTINNNGDGSRTTVNQGMVPTTREHKK